MMYPLFIDNMKRGYINFEIEIQSQCIGRYML